MGRIKKITAVAVVLSLLLAAFSVGIMPFAGDAEPVLYEKGDIDGSTGITVEDARLILRAAVGLVILDEDLADYADVNGDGEIGVDDARTVLRVAVDLESFEKTHEHIFVNYVEDNNATCYSNATKTARCEYEGCNAKSVVEHLETKADHSFTHYTVTKEATCEENGSQKAECIYGCGTEDVKVIQRLGHRYLTYVNDHNATCTKNGTETSACVNCGKLKTRDIPGSALGHRFLHYTRYVCPTCESDAKLLAVCENDGCTETDCILIDDTKLENCVFGDYISDNNATNESDGTKTATCIYCGKKNVVADEGSRLTHVYLEYEYNNDATCYRNGTETAVDTVDGVTTHTRVAVNTKLAHHYSSYTINNDATCTHNATKYAVCDLCSGLCGAVDIQEVAGTQLKHSFTNYAYNNDATCEKDGTKTACCEYGCGAVDTVSAPDTATGHSIGSYIPYEKATCMKNATEIGVCSTCGQKDIREIPNTKIQHSFTHYVKDKDATYTHNATEIASCDYGCGTTNSRDIPGTQLELTGKEGYKGFSAGNSRFTSAQEMMEYFNTNVNRIKQQCPAFTLTEASDVDIKAVDSASGLPVSTIVGVIEGAVSDNVKADDDTNNIARNQNCIGLLSVKNQNYVSDLSASDIYGAKCSESNGIIKIEIALYDIMMDEVAESPYRKITDAGVDDDKGIVDKLTSLLSAQESKIASLYKNGLVTAEFDAATGNVISYSVVYDQVTKARDVKMLIVSADEVTVTITESEICTNFFWG